MGTVTAVGGKCELGLIINQSFAILYDLRGCCLVEIACDRGLNPGSNGIPKLAVYFGPARTNFIYNVLISAKYLGIEISTGDEVSLLGYDCVKFFIAEFTSVV